MNVYHGTLQATASALAGNPASVAVTVGGGELGRGFYTGDSVAMAAAWARGRYSASAVLEITIDVSAYVRLSIRTLNWNQVVNTWNQLSFASKTNTFLFGYDVVYGPLATYPHVAQHKFESTVAEGVLRSSGWRIV